MPKRQGECKTLTHARHPALLQSGDPARIWTRARRYGALHVVWDGHGAVSAALGSARARARTRPWAPANEPTPWASSPSPSAWRGWCWPPWWAGSPIARPRTWTMRDAESTLEAAEVFAAALGLLARGSRVGQAAVVIGGVLALGAAVALA